MAAGRSVGVNLILRVINGVTPSRRPFFLIFFTSTFLQRDFKCTGSFLQRDGHFPQEKQYFLSFVGFSCPRKASEIVSRNRPFFGAGGICHAVNPVVKNIFFWFFSESFFTTETYGFYNGF